MPSYVAGAFCRETPVIPDEAVAMAEHEGEAEGIERQTAKAGIDDGLHQHVHRLAGAAKAGLQHGEADLHAEDKDGRHQSPDGIDGVNNNYCPSGRIGDVDAGVGQAGGSTSRLHSAAIL